jgi:hypothetical protein
MDDRQPPANVQHAVSAAKIACAGWPPPRLQTSPKQPPTPPPSYEEQVCAYIRDPSAEAWTFFEFGADVTLFAILFVVVLEFHRVPGILWKRMTRMYRQMRTSACA